MRSLRGILALVMACVSLASLAMPAVAQGTYGPPLPTIRDGRAVAPEAVMPLIPALNNGEAIGSPSGLNPIDVLSSATRLLPEGRSPVARRGSDGGFRRS